MHTGISEIEPKLELKLDDQEILSVLKRKVDNAIADMKVDKVPARRERMHRYWKGEFDFWDTYDYEDKNLYTENRVYMYVEHLVAQVNSNLAQPEAVPNSKTYESRQLAVQFRDFLMSWVEQNGVKALFKATTRNNQLDFIGAIKIDWDKNKGPRTEDGRLGDISLYVVKPDNLIISDDFTPDKQGAFIAEILEENLDDVLLRFPKKKREILQKIGKRGVNTQMGAKVKYYEVWFTYYQGGEAKVGRMWCSPDLDVVFGKEKHPHWDEDGEMLEGERVYSNLLEAPLYPYSLLYNRDSSNKVIDATNSIEQVLPLQDVICRRGFQIQQFADDNRGGWVFSAEAISDEDAAKFTNNPEDHLRLKGDIRAGVDRKPPNILPQFIYQSIQDARAQMDNIVGLHSVSRGERMGDDQPTSLQLLREGDFSRQDGLIEGIDRCAEFLYKYIAHLMKMHYTEEHYVVKAGEEGKSIYLKYNKDALKDGIELYVKAGTTLPTDKVSQRQEAMDLMQIGKIDYITFFDRLGYPNPKEQAHKLYLHENAPQQLYEAGNSEEEAEEDIEMIKSGRKPASPDDISDAYLGAIMQFFKSEEFQNMPEDFQQIGKDYLNEVVQKGRMKSQGPALQPETPGPQQPAAPDNTPPAQQRLPNVA